MKMEKLQEWYEKNAEHFRLLSSDPQHRPKFTKLTILRRGSEFILTHVLEKGDGKWEMKQPVQMLDDSLVKMERPSIQFDPRGVQWFDIARSNAAGFLLRDHTILTNNGRIHFINGPVAESLDPPPSMSQRAYSAAFGLSGMAGRAASRTARAALGVMGTAARAASRSALSASRAMSRAASRTARAALGATGNALGRTRTFISNRARSASQAIRRAAARNARSLARYALEHIAEPNPEPGAFPVIQNAHGGRRTRRNRSKRQ
jgi:hypothetical protein